MAKPGGEAGNRKKVQVRTKGGQQKILCRLGWKKAGTGVKLGMLVPWSNRGLNRKPDCSLTDAGTNHSSKQRVEYLKTRKFFSPARAITHVNSKRKKTIAKITKGREMPEGGKTRMNEVSPQPPMLQRVRERKLIMAGESILCGMSTESGVGRVHKYKKKSWCYMAVYESQKDKERKEKKTTKGNQKKVSMSRGKRRKDVITKTK